MEGSNAVEQPLPNEININPDAKIGQDKCPKCGATDISFDPKKGVLRCNYCRYEFASTTVEQTDVFNLTGEVFTTGSSNITSEESLITLKCQSCGAEVVVDTNESTQSRCHWCRNMLSINAQVPNGAVPDMILPFKLEKANARKNIEDFVGKRKFFANTTFKNEFTTENIMGVYLPYLVVDINSHASFSGYGEHQTRAYTVGNKDHQRRVYDADLYKVYRDYDMAIKGLTVESSKDRLNNASDEKTNNVINAIMPFDIENCILFKSNYLRGFTSEKRDLNVEAVQKLVERQAVDIARFASNETLKFYDRGVKFDSENVNIIGSQWKTAYLPVWLYSYQEVKNDKKTLHYVAVNARTSETMGSVPINMAKLLFFSCLVENLGLILMLFISDFDYSFIFLSFGIVFYIVHYHRYRNKKERHRHEFETAKEVKNMKKEDVLVQHKRGLNNSTMSGANNNHVEGITNR